MALILIAEDDEIVVDIVREALERRGHVVGALDDGLLVAQIVNLKRPDLVILDCSLPEVSGVEALRPVRVSKHGFAVPVLMLTGRRGEQDEEIARRAGASDYLRKPFEPDELVFRVESLIDRARTRRAPTPPLAGRSAAALGWGQR